MPVDFLRKIISIPLEYVSRFTLITTLIVSILVLLLRLLSLIWHKDQVFEIISSALIETIFVFILTFLGTEWISLRHSMEVKIGNMSNEWNLFKSEIELKIEKVNYLSIILKECFEANIIKDSFFQNIEKALKFDKMIKNDMQDLEHHIDFNAFVSKLKFKDFLDQHFIFSSDDKNISWIPTYYFEKEIWPTLVEISDIYLSNQVLDSLTSKEYLKDIPRRRSEINKIKKFFTAPTNKTKLKKLDKLFVIDEEWLNKKENSKIKKEIQSYLIIWQSLSNDIDKVNIKVIDQQRVSGSTLKPK